MINIDRLNRISESKRAEYISMLREFNDSFHGVEEAAMEAIQCADASNAYMDASQIALEYLYPVPYDKGALVPVQKVGDTPLRKAMGFIRTNLSKTIATLKGASKKQIAIAAAAAVASIVLIALTGRVIKRFTNFNEKATRVFKKFEEVIVPGKDSIDPEAFKASKAKLIHTDKYQVLFKTAGDLTKQIKGFMANYTTKPIVWNKDMFHGMDFVTKTDKNGVEMIKEIKLSKDFSATKTTIGSAGWDLEKAFKLAPVIKAIIETTAEFKRYGETFAAEEKKLQAAKKSLKGNPEEQTKVIAQMLLIKANLADFNHVLKAYFSLIGVVCGQFFTLTAHMKVKKA